MKVDLNAENKRTWIKIGNWNK